MLMRRFHFYQMPWDSGGGVADKGRGYGGGGGNPGRGSGGGDASKSKPKTAPKAPPAPKGPIKDKHAEEARRRRDDVGDTKKSTPNQDTRSSKDGPINDDKIAAALGMTPEQYKVHKAGNVDKNKAIEAEQDPINRRVDVGDTKFGDVKRDSPIKDKGGKPLDLNLVSSDPTIPDDFAQDMINRRIDVGDTKADDDTRGGISDEFAQYMINRRIDVGDTKFDEPRISDDFAQYMINRRIDVGDTKFDDKPQSKGNGNGGGPNNGPGGAGEPGPIKNNGPGNGGGTPGPIKKKAPAKKKFQRKYLPRKLF